MERPSNLTMSILPSTSYLPIGPASSDLPLQSPYPENKPLTANDLFKIIEKSDAESRRNACMESRRNEYEQDLKDLKLLLNLPT